MTPGSVWGRDKKCKQGEHTCSHVLEEAGQLPVSTSPWLVDSCLSIVSSQWGGKYKREREERWERGWGKGRKRKRRKLENAHSAFSFKSALFPLWELASMSPRGLPEVRPQAQSQQTLGLKHMKSGVAQCTAAGYSKPSPTLSSTKVRAVVGIPPGSQLSPSSCVPHKHLLIRKAWVSHSICFFPCVIHSGTKMSRTCAFLFSSEEMFSGF